MPGSNRRSNRTCHPTSRPSVQPCSSAIRRATLRAATRRGCSTMTGPVGGERRRDPRRFSRARRGRHDQGAALANARDDLGDEGIDREGLGGHQGILPRSGQETLTDVDP